MNKTIFALCFLSVVRVTNLAYCQSVNDLQVAIEKKDRTLILHILASLEPKSPHAVKMVNEVNSTGRTALILAIENRAGFDVIRSLLDRGANVNAIDSDRKTPLLYAAEQGQQELVEVLLSRGADVHLADQSGKTALENSLMAAKTEQEQFKALKLYQKYGVQLDHPFSGGQTLLSWAIGQKAERLAQYLLSPKILKKGKEKAGDRMISLSQIDSPDVNGRTSLHAAVMTAQFQIVEALVEAGARVTPTDRFGWSPVTMLLALPTPSNAAKVEQVQWLKTFLEKGGDPHQSFPLDKQAFANKREYDQLSGRTLLAWAVHENRTDVIRVLMSFGADLGPVDSLLMAAVERGNLEMVKLAVERGADVCSVSSSHPSGHTPLTLASEKGRLEILRFMLDSLIQSGVGLVSQRGCDLHTLGKKGLTALGWAGKVRNLAIARVLVEKGGEQYIGAEELKQVLSSSTPTEYVAKWIQLYDAVQGTSKLASLLELKTKCTLSFEGERLEQQHPEFVNHVNSLKNIMNTKARELYYRERYPEVREEFKVASRSTLANPDLCLSCGDHRIDAEDPNLDLGPAECSCFLCQDCAPSYCEMIVQRMGDDIGVCPGCRGMVSAEYLERQHRSAEEVIKVRNRLVDQMNSKQPGWVFCPTVGCVGGRVVQPKEKSAFYSCFFCGHEGCIRCGNDHQGECGQYAKQMKEFEKLLKLGAEAPPEHRPTDENHRDFLKGRFRPCYHCGVITERTEGCTHMTCTRCGKDWHWNLGNYSNNYDYARSKMKYKPLKDPHF